MESIQIFLKLDGLFKAEANVPAKTIQFIWNLDRRQKLIENRSVGNKARFSLAMQAQVQAQAQAWAAYAGENERRHKHQNQPR